MSNVTPEDLISYLYGETDATRTAEIESALSANWALREKLSVLQTSMHRLDKAKLSSPSEGVLNSIMAYAQSAVAYDAKGALAHSQDALAHDTQGVVAHDTQGGGEKSAQSGLPQPPGAR